MVHQRICADSPFDMVVHETEISSDGMAMEYRSYPGRLAYPLLDKSDYQSQSNHHAYNRMATIRNSSWFAIGR